MDLGTLLGILAGFGLTIFGIGFGSIGNFIDPASFALTIGGTLAAMAASTPSEVLKDLPKLFKIAFGGKKYDP